MYTRILLAVDGSEHSERAAKEAVKLAKGSTKSQVTIVFVADYDDSKKEVLHSGSSSELDLKRRKNLQPVEDALSAGGVNYKVEILHGTPGPAIVEYANQDEFDVLVIGSRGLNSLQEMVLGSVSHKVVKRANCPVLIVK
ncbi:Universal stress protein family [Planococcus halocryophilus Or1]|uniref:Universal stress protein n=1 Tax=Planococcus halocryophilus TaxID=1215089 RepID=A0A1C7DM44_9BACL|nr:universal stress protein [Planococcus halocryophilus]ANU12659.1 universal stress protein [Planococcus halocryophilus]EMF47139.1 Universal stress protein family [Planococcus halocryophilus Or1]